MKVTLSLNQRELDLLNDSFFLYGLSFERPDVVRVIDKINREIVKTQVKAKKNGLTKV